MTLTKPLNVISAVRFVRRSLNTLRSSEEGSVPSAKGGRELGKTSEKSNHRVWSSSFSLGSDSPIKHASGSPGGFVKTQIAGPHSSVSDTGGLRQGPRICISNKLGVGAAAVVKN